MLTWASNSGGLADGMGALGYLVADVFGFVAVQTHSKIRCIKEMDVLLLLSVVSSPSFFLSRVVRFAVPFMLAHV